MNAVERSLTTLRDRVRHAQEVLTKWEKGQDVRQAQDAVGRQASLQGRRKTGVGQVDRALLNEAIQLARPKIVRYLLQNFDHSGLKNETGRLRSAVANSIVGLGGGARRPFLSISFPTGLPNSKSTKDRTKKSVYVYGAAHNFGAVYVPRINRIVKDLPTGKQYTAVRPILGQKAKKSLKKAALKEVYSHKVDRHLGKFGIVARPQHFHDLGKEIVGHNVRIIKPRRYYYLTSAQQADVLKEVTANYQRLKAQAAARN